MKRREFITLLSGAVTLCAWGHSISATILSMARSCTYASKRPTYRCTCLTVRV